MKHLILSKKHKLSLLIFVFIALSVGVLSTNKVSALSGSEFQAGRIIDDSIFYNGTAMGAQEIQNFLNAKVPTCDTNGSQPSNRAGYATRADWGRANGYAPPYICLRDYSENTPTKPADAYCVNTYNGGIKSAAQIIRDVGVACNISQKSMIVLLQKEQSLITDDWPWSIQYRSATGYGCPDTAPCDAEYYGFFNQVYNAARQFQRYRVQSNLFNYRAGQTRYVQYNPNAGCGGTNVYIENAATAGLYNYTPYQPNPSALNNLYGSGDACGAYGNRNFWRMHNDWFGSTSGPAFHATYQSQSSYPIIDSGLGISVFFQFKNTGTAFWKDDASTFPGWNPVRLANTWPINRPSMFKASNWSAPTRPTGFFSKVFENDGVTLAADQHTVFPGQVARFEFTINVDPSIPSGVYREYFQPILEGGPGYSWNLNAVAYLDIGVNRPDYKASFHSQGGYPTVSKGDSTYTFVRFKNTGSSPWYDDASNWPGKSPVRLATTWPINRQSVFSSNWPFTSRPTVRFYKVLLADGTTLAPSQNAVQPGQVAEFVIPIDVPLTATSGSYREYFQPIVEGAPYSSWDMGAVSWTQITVL
jgi:hypothetical protein